jgi:hypothetical protein
VDDFETIANKFIGRLLYTDMTIAGGLIHGVYSRDCPWEDTKVEDSSRVPFMDVLQVFWEWEGIMLSTTELYDKRRDKIYSDIDYIQYAHATTCLSRDCLQNILTGQVCRFSRIIMEQGNFTTEVAILLHKLQGQGFKLQPLLVRYKRYIKSRPQLFGGVGWQALYDRVIARLGL